VFASPHPWKSTTARIAVSYGLFFVVWAVVLVVLIYWQTANRLSEDTEHQLRERADYLASLDPPLLRDSLQAMYQFDLLHINSYGLFDRAGAPLAGHIAQIPADVVFDDASHIYRMPGPDGSISSVRVLAVHLRDGEQLLLARDAGLIDQLHDLILRAVFWGLSLTIVPGLAGGILLGIQPLRRIRHLQEAGDRIVAGRLDQRLPVTGRGDELDMLAGIVNRMLEQIERLMLEVKSVCDNIAHDLRTPLTHLRGALHRIQQQTPAGDARLEVIDEAVLETDELLQRFSALLRISELRNEQRRAAFAEVDLGEVLEQVYGLYEPVAEEKAIRLSLEVAPLPRIRGDRLLLIEAFSNLVANAIKFTPEQGRVLVQARPEAQGPRVDVIDTGPGIPPTQRQAIFERFYRLDQSRSTPGFGLGLSIVEAIVRLHGFQVEAGGVAGAGGARLTVRCWAEEGA
jgi:signal transduction histidine kinase